MDSPVEELKVKTQETVGWAQQLEIIFSLALWVAETSIGHQASVISFIFCEGFIFMGLQFVKKTF